MKDSRRHFCATILILSLLVAQTGFATDTCHPTSEQITVPQGTRWLLVKWDGATGMVGPDNSWDCNGVLETKYKYTPGSWGLTIESPGGTPLEHKRTVKVKTYHVRSNQTVEGTIPPDPPRDIMAQAVDVSSYTSDADTTFTIHYDYCWVDMETTEPGGVISHSTLAVHRYMTVAAVLLDGQVMIFDQPIIPTDSRTDNEGCVQLKQRVWGAVSNHSNGSAVPGITTSFKSDRNVLNPNRDRFRPPRARSDEAGFLRSFLYTRHLGTPSISLFGPGFADERMIPATATLTSANYESLFDLTAYITALETDARWLNGPSETIPNIPGTYKSAFLHNRWHGVPMEGWGHAANGRYIGLNTAATKAAGHHVFVEAPCARDRANHCLAADALAVDDNIVPIPSFLNIAGLGDRHAVDVGGRIGGYHIDVYVGEGEARVQEWEAAHHTTPARVRFVSYDGDYPCQ